MTGGSLISVAQGIVAVPADASVITGVVGIGQGGTGQTTAAAALTALGAGGGSTIQTPTINGGTISGATITGETVSGGTITNPTLSGTITLATATFTGGATMVGTYAGGTYSGATITGGPGNFTTLGATSTTTLGSGSSSYFTIDGDNSNFPVIKALGGTNANFKLAANGSGGLYFQTAGSTATQAVIAHTASAVDNIQLTGGATGTPGTVTLSAQGSDANVNVALTPKGQGSLVSTNSLRISNTLVTTQGAPSAKTTSTTLTAAEVLSGIVTANQGAAGAATYTMPLGTALGSGLPSDFPNNGSFTFSLVNISTNLAETATLATNTGITLVGGMTVIANSAAGVASSAPFLVRQTAANTFTVYRMG